MPCPHAATFMMPAIAAIALFCTSLDAAQSSCCGTRGLEMADEYRVAGLDDRRFNHAQYWSVLDAVLAGDSTGRVEVTEVGRSIEGRAINAVTMGTGPITVLLWSQMHGDESTASMSLADIIHWFAASPEDDGLRRKLEDRLTITMIPMLNPDGAERFIRHNAIGIDVNRDARRLATPEGRILKAVRDSLEADFGFNLHDQGSRSAGPEGDLVAIALLAPAADEDGSWGPVRQRARQLSAVIAAALQEEIPDLVARYDDTFTPRAFGDNMQLWGTSTVLIESGALRGDPQKQKLRELNVLAILAALESVADGSYEATSARAYDDLPLNVSISYDLILSGSHIVMGSGNAYRADIGIVFDDAAAGVGPRYSDVGDLSDVRAVEIIDASGLYVHPDLGSEYSLRRGEPARFVIRRGVSTDSPAVMRFPDSDAQRPE